MSIGISNLPRQLSKNEFDNLFIKASSLWKKI